MCRKLSFGAVAILWLAGLAAAQDLASLEGPVLRGEKDMQALCEGALMRLTKGQSGGFDLLRQHSVDKKEDAELDRFFRSQADRVKNFIRRWGKPLEHKLIARRRVGDSFFRYVYLCKYEKNFLRWSFTFYQPKDGWYFFRLDFDDDIKALFEGAGVSVPTTALSRPMVSPAR